MPTVPGSWWPNGGTLGRARHKVLQTTERWGRRSRDAPVRQRSRPRGLDEPPARLPVATSQERTVLTVRRVAALPPSQDLTGPPFGDEPRVLKGRRGGTDEFLGRGSPLPQSPCLSGRGGRPLDKCLVQLHADAVIRKSSAALSEAVNSSPVITPRKEKNSSPVRGAPVDRRGHIRVRPESSHASNTSNGLLLRRLGDELGHSWLIFRHALKRLLGFAGRSGLNL